MRALVVSIQREPWPANMIRHWHLVDTYLSQHVVTAVEAQYGRMATVTEINTDDPYIECPECGQTLGGSNGQG